MEENTDEAELWQRAKDLKARAENGEIKISQDQMKRLNSMLEGYEAYIEADTELKKGMIGLLYEKQIYLSKLWLLEKLGVQNQWKHPLLQQIRDVLYEETDEFKVDDYRADQN